MLPFRRRPNGIEPEQRARRDADPTAVRPGEGDEVWMLQEHARAEDDHFLAGAHHRFHEHRRELSGKTFHREVRQRLQRLERHNWHIYAEVLEPPLRRVSMGR
jgi:hypothetical protein